MGKKKTTEGGKARIRCADCRHTKPKSDLCVHCDTLDVGRVKNSFRNCGSYEEK